jgi:hypothetical protein
VRLAEGEDAKIDTGQMKVDAGESDTADTPHDAVNALNVAIVQRNTVLEAENQRLQTALSAMHADLRRYKLEVISITHASVSFNYHRLKTMRMI